MNTDSTTAQGLNELLRSIEVALAGARHMEKYAAQLAPRFFIFDYLRDDEMGLSRCLADLLDPAGTHGQGSLFLEAFVKLLPGPNHFSGKVRRVVTELSAHGRRIDIYIEYENGAMLALENKPWAGDQQNQLFDYAAFLEQQSGNRSAWMLVYLCNEVPDISSISTAERSRRESQQQLALVKFGQLCEALENCNGKVQALPVQIFVQELVKFIRRHVNGESSMLEQKEIVATITANSVNVLHAFTVGMNLAQTRMVLMQKLKRDLHHLLSQDKYRGITLQAAAAPGDHDWWGEQGTQTWSGCVFQLDAGASFGQVDLRFEFNKPNYNMLFWGIKSFAPLHARSDLSLASKVFAALRNKGLCHAKEPEQKWTTWRDFREGDSIPPNWFNNPKVWADIASEPDAPGNIARAMVDLVQGVQQELQGA